MNISHDTDSTIDWYRTRRAERLERAKQAHQRMESAATLAKNARIAGDHARMDGYQRQADNEHDRWQAELSEANFYSDRIEELIAERDEDLGVLRLF